MSPAIHGFLALAALLMAPPARANCAAASAYAAARDGVALLVIDHGKVTCENPAGGAGPQELWSGTKSMIGLAAAAAVQDRLLTLDERASDTLTEWRADPAKRDVTIRQLLSMTAGLPSRIGAPPGYAESLTMPFDAAPGTRFEYGPAPIQAFGELLARKLAARHRDASPQAYITRRIFAPIGLQVGTWRMGADGNALLPQGLVLSAREWAKVGTLVLDGGRVEGRWIVDPDAFAALFRGSAANPSYGLTWWLPKGPPAGDPVTATVDIGRHGEDLPRDLVVAAGAGDQRLYVIPSRRLVIVRQAKLDLEALRRGAPVAKPPERRWSDTAFLKALLAPAQPASRAASPGE